MARAVWVGAISLGMVSIPVRLFPATRRRDVRFRELDRVTGRRVQHRRVRAEVPDAAPADEGWEPPPERPFRGLSESPAAERGLRREVGRDDIVKGFEVSPGRFVTMAPDELEALQPERSRTIDVELFVDADAVDPVYYDAAYHAVPQLDHVRTLALLAEAMREERRVAISWVVLRRRRHLAALRPFGEGLLLSTMFHADEVLPAPGAAFAGAALTDREREMARLLLQTLSGAFEPGGYRDEYRARLLAMIEERAGGAIESAEPEPAVAPASVDDLLTALQASIEQAKMRRGRAQEPGRRRRHA